MITQTINLNMVPGSVYPVIHVNQYDNDSGALKFNLYTGSTAFSIPSSSAIVINGTKPDGYGFSYTATYSGNVVTANVTQQMTAVAGEVKCELRITKSSNVVGTQNFTLMVEPAALDDNTIISNSDIPAIAAAADYAAQAAQSATTAATTLASAKRLSPVTSIASGTNLNNLTTPGEYYVSSTPIAQTLTNWPFSGVGRLTVETSVSSSTYLRQTASRVAGTEILNRYSTDGGSTWSDWAGSNVVSVLLGPGETATFNISNYIAMIVCKRSTHNYVGVVTYADSDVLILSSAGTIPTVTTEANSNTVTVKNNHANTSFPVMFITKALT